jgi:hypothetical protein
VAQQRKNKFHVGQAGGENREISRDKKTEEKGSF